jgi:hypothetical protein
MSPTKLTPLEVLQKQKLRLQHKSDVLTERLENDFDYFQNNIGTILSNTAMKAIVTKTPPVIQSLLGINRNTETDSCSRSGLIAGALDVLPVFFKGPKQWIARFIIGQVKRWIFTRKY